jgi:hypothetical protein
MAPHASQLTVVRLELAVQRLGQLRPLGRFASTAFCF